MKRLILACTLILPAAAAQAQTEPSASRQSNISGKKLVEVCTSREKPMVELCTAYVDGLADAASFYQRALPVDGSKGGKLPAYICVPSATTGTQMRETVVGWIRKHAGQADRQASSLVLRALNDSYLCPGEKPAQ